MSTTWELFQKPGNELTITEHSTLYDFELREGSVEIELPDLTAPEVFAVCQKAISAVANCSGLHPGDAEKAIQALIDEYKKEYG